MDRQLVERAIQGDEDAYAGLMAIAGDRLLAIAYRILRDLHQAEDAVQVALVNAWRDLPTLRDADRFEAWLTRLLVRACYAEADRGRRWNANMRVLPIDVGGQSDVTSTVVDRDRLDRGVRRLPNDQRAIVVLGGNGMLASAELYDSGPGTWTAAGTIATPRAGQTATVLPDGRVLVAGGMSVIDGTARPQASAELYDPGTGH
jgi:RNA polymerase sigma-70 factor (ECF subfamily)